MSLRGTERAATRATRVIRAIAARASAMRAIIAARSMRCDRSRESECLRDALSDALGVAAGRIRADIDAIESTCLTNFRFDLRCCKLVLRMREKRLCICKVRKRAELH